MYFIDNHILRGARKYKINNIRFFVGKSQKKTSFQEKYIVKYIETFKIYFFKIFFVIRLEISKKEEEETKIENKKKYLYR